MQRAHAAPLTADLPKFLEMQMSQAKAAFRSFWMRPFCMKNTFLHEQNVFRARAHEREKFFVMQNRKRHPELTSVAGLPSPQSCQDFMDKWLHNAVENARRPPGLAVDRSA